MTTSRYILGLALLASVCATGSYLAAQPAEPADDAADDAADVTVPMRKRANLSPEDMMTERQNIVGSIRAKLQETIKLQATTRNKSEKDIIKINCINHHLKEMRKLLDIADEASNNLDEAISLGDDDGRYHEFHRISLVDEEVARLAREAQKCVGEQELTFLGPTEVEVDGPTIPDDPTEEPLPDFGIERPGFASPFF